MLISGVLGAAACGTNGSTNPESALISVRLRNDAGAPGGRHRVLVTRTVGDPDSRQASVNGTGDIAVAGAGTYLIRVVPSSGFVWTEQLRRIVSVSDGGRISVNFTLYREGQPIDTLPPIDDGWGRDLIR